MNLLGNIKKLGFRPNLMHISILHIRKICFNAKVLSEISLYDFDMANKQKFKGNLKFKGNFSVKQFLENTKMS